VASEVMSLLKKESRKTVRKSVAKVRITWAGNAVDLTEAHTLDTQPENRVSIKQQTIKAIGIQRRWAFCETDDPSVSTALLDNNICLMPDNNDKDVENRKFLVGWWGSNANIAGVGGRFAVPQVLQITFGAASISAFRLHGYLACDAEYSEWPVDFNVSACRREGDNYVVCQYSDGAPAIVVVRDNTEVNCSGSFREEIRDVEMLRFEIIVWSHRGAFVKITEAYGDFTLQHDSGDIMSMSLLEEADGTVGALPIGNISCNELNLSLQNIDDSFSIGNTNSALSGQARSNRRIEPFIGFEIYDKSGVHTGTKYVPKGVYWSRDWNVSIQGTTASTSALDRLGLLQEIDYNGIGHINTEQDMAERSMWPKDTSLYVVARDILQDLRETYMPDLEFVINESLKNERIPLAFFKRQSYFDVIKTIAQAAAAYAYMDTPTEEELAVIYKERGNTMCADILRIEKLEHLFPVTGDILPLEILMQAEKIKYDDIIDQTIQQNRSDMVNVVVVPWQKYEPVGGVPKPPENSEAQYAREIDERSIKEYGRLEHEYPENNLIQTELQARAIANSILKVFSGTQRRSEINVFGDVTSRVGDIWDIPEYQKRGINNRGIYVVTRLNTDYDGALRQSVTCRRIGGISSVPLPTDIDLIDEIGSADIIIVETGDAPVVVEEQRDKL